jgi:hypothetical protein
MSAVITNSLNPIISLITGFLIRYEDLIKRRGYSKSLMKKRTAINSISRNDNIKIIPIKVNAKDVYFCDRKSFIE